ncbi:MAG: transposase [Fuerstiella sp.]
MCGHEKSPAESLNQWESLCRYTDDGTLDIDNNLTERMVND